MIIVQSGYFNKSIHPFQVRSVYEIRRLIVINSMLHFVFGLRLQQRQKEQTQDPVGNDADPNRLR